jgi:hypothetical protein
MANTLFHAWALSKPVHSRIPLSNGNGLFVIRSLGPGIFIVPCPGCESWLNIPLTGRARKLRGIEKALWGPLNCLFCETRLTVTPEKIQVLKLGNPRKKRKPPGRKPRKNGRKPPERQPWDIVDVRGGEDDFQQET